MVFDRYAVPCKPGRPLMSADGQAASRSPGSSLASDERGQIIDLLVRFEAAWKEGPQPRIEDYLAAAPDSLRSSLLRDLVHVEVELRYRNGENPDPDAYRQRFPELD